MRKMIVAAVALAVASVQAAEAPKFGDVNYFFKHGQVNALANFNDVYDKANILGTMTETRGYVVETQLTYGFSDQLNAFIGLDYAYDLETETSGNPDIGNDGLANPALGAIYRIRNQSSTDYNIDIGAIARLNIQDAEEGFAVPGNSEDGNFAHGRASAELLGRIGRKWNIANEWQLAGGAVYFNDGEVTNKDATGDEKQDIGSSFDLYLRATYQYRPVNEIMFLLSAQATQFGEIDSELVDGSKISQDSRIDYDFRFITKYLITENFIAKFSYGMSRNADFDVKAAGVSGEVQKRRANYFGLGVDFLF